METRDRAGGIDRRVLSNIHFNARRLDRHQAVPGMVVDDYAQDLILDLLHRRDAFDPARGSFVTFADRIVGHRAVTLAKPSARLRAERGTISLDAPVVHEDGAVAALVDLLPDTAPAIDAAVMIRIDVERFIDALPEPLVEACDLLLADSITAGARAAGIHRSTAYDRIEHLRREANAWGLDIYCVCGADSSVSTPVCGGHGACGRQSRGDQEAVPMAERKRPPRVSLLIGEDDLRAWLATAKPGDVLQYHRGVLAIDRLVHGSRLADQDRRQLDRVAETLLTLANSGRGHLLQRRHGEGDYRVGGRCAGA